MELSHPVRWGHCGPVTRGCAAVDEQVNIQKEIDLPQSSVDNHFLRTHKLGSAQSKTCLRVIELKLGLSRGVLLSSEMKIAEGKAGWHKFILRKARWAVLFSISFTNKVRT